MYHEPLYVIGVMLLSALVHELGHYYASKYYGVLRGYGIWKGNPAIDNSEYNSVIALIGFFSSLLVYPLIYLSQLGRLVFPFKFYVLYQAVCSSYDFYIFFKTSILRIPYKDKIYPRGINGWWFYIPYRGGS